MSTNPKYQFSKENSIKPRHQQDYKARLLSGRFPDAAGEIDPQKLYMVDVKDPKIARIQTRDGGWLEIEGRQIKTYGPKGYAAEVAQKLESAGYADNIEHLEESIRIGMKGQRRQHIPNAMLDAQAETIADKWRSRGYTDVQDSPDGVYIRIGQSRLQDLGDEVRLHGKPSEAALRAMVAKSADEWGSEIEVTGSKSFKDALWLEAQRQGVKVYDNSTGDFYKPSPEIAARWAADLARMQGNEHQIDGIRQVKKLTSLMKNAAAGDKDSLQELQKRDPALTAFLAQHLDADQLKLLAQESDADLEPQLDGMRELGREILEESQQAAQSQGIKPVTHTPDSPVEEALLSLEDTKEYTEAEDPDAPKSRRPS